MDVAQRLVFGGMQIITTSQDALYISRSRSDLPKLTGDHGKLLGSTALHCSHLALFSIEHAVSAFVDVIFCVQKCPKLRVLIVKRQLFNFGGIWM